MKTIVASFLIFLVTGAIPTFAQNADAKLRSELIRLHTEWFGAFDRGDGAAMDRMEVPNVALVFQDGTLWKKAEPRVGKQKPTQFTSRTLTDVELRQFGNAAILTGSLISKSADSGLDEAGTTVVFVRQGPEWRIASAQWSVTKRPEDDINRAGYELMNSGRVTEAIEVLKMNVRLYPESWNAYDSLGEAYANAGDTILAIQSYEKSVQLNPKNVSGMAALAKLKAK